MANEILLEVYPNHCFASHGQSLLITDRAGAITGGLDGLYEHDTRLLSRYRLLIHGRIPRLDALSSVTRCSTLAYYVCAAGWESSSSQLLEEELDRQVVLRVARFVGQGLHEDVEMTNHGLRPAPLDLVWDIASDFADFFDVRDGYRLGSSPVAGEWQIRADGPPELRFDAPRPLVGLGMMLRLLGTRSRPSWDGEHLRYSVTLGPQERHTICSVVAPIRQGTIHEPIFGCDSFFIPDVPGSRASEQAATGTLPPADLASPAWL